MVLVPNGDQVWCGDPGVLRDSDDDVDSRSAAGATPFGAESASRAESALRAESAFRAESTVGPRPGLTLLLGRL